MSKIEKFEDLIAWQKARGLAVKIYEITKSGDFSKDYDLARQIRRAAISTMSNIAEGFERAGRSEFHQFLVIAKASCAELRSQLYVAHDVGYLDKSAFKTILFQSEELAKIIGGLRSSVERQRNLKAKQT